jgi:hypothetical protein
MTCYRRVRAALLALLAFLIGERVGTAGRPFFRPLPTGPTWMRRTHDHRDSPDGHEERFVGLRVHVVAADAPPPSSTLVGDGGHAMMQIRAAFAWREHTEKETMCAIQANMRHAAATL